MTTETRHALPRATVRPARPGLPTLLLIVRVLAVVHGALAGGGVGLGALWLSDGLARPDDAWADLAVLIGGFLVVYALAVGAAVLVTVRAAGPRRPYAAAAVIAALPVTAAVQQRSVDIGLGTAGTAYVVLCAVTLVVALAGLVAGPDHR